MKLVFIIILILIIFLYYPQFNEGAESSCASLERQVLRVVTENKEDSIFLGLLFKGFSNGAFTQEVVKSKYPKLPPMIGCSILYYDVILNPERVLNLKSNL